CAAPSEGEADEFGQNDLAVGVGQKQPCPSHALDIARENRFGVVGVEKLKAMFPPQCEPWICSPWTRVIIRFATCLARAAVKKIRKPVKDPLGRHAVEAYLFD